MIPFLTDDFMLHNETGKRLFHDFAAQQPIYDYHCHLPPADIHHDRQFDNLTQIWLAGDHYKWRAMRTAGIDEARITGHASEREKFDAWAKTVPLTMGNPLFHWTALELKRPFGITDTLLTPDSADKIWHQTQEQLSQPEFSARGIMQQMNVTMVGTTDDPIDSLAHHAAIASDPTFTIDVKPSWRPDKVFKIEQPGFNDYLIALSHTTDMAIHNFPTLLQALEIRLDHFAEHGCVAADHGIEIVRYHEIPSEATLNTIMEKRRNEQPLSEQEIAQFSTAVQVWLGKQYAKRHWVMQMHIGAIRNNNTRMFEKLGPDSGYDSIGDRLIAYPLSRLLNDMDKTNELPKTILYCLNPRDNEVIATMAGNFQGGGIAGKIQFGSGWWFNDQKDGMQRQLTQLSQLGLLSQFVGMLTDSRSFLSYTRHEYFRRILANLLGQWIEAGELPNDINYIGAMLQNICYHNAKHYFDITS